MFAWAKWNDTFNQIFTQVLSLEGLWFKLYSDDQERNSTLRIAWIVQQFFQRRCYPCDGTMCISGRRLLLQFKNLTPLPLQKCTLICTYMGLEQIWCRLLSVEKITMGRWDWVEFSAVRYNDDVVTLPSGHLIGFVGDEVHQKPLGMKILELRVGTLFCWTEPLFRAFHQIWLWFWF